MPIDKYLIFPEIAKHAFVNSAQYKEWYQRSLDDPQAFWAEQAKKFVSWYEPWEKVLTGGLDLLDVQWFAGGKLNVSYNCLDRHLNKRAHQPAIIWEGDNPNHTQTLSYQQLFDEVCRFANVLKKQGVKRGDRVCIYLPMIPEVAVAMLACTRIGAIHTVVFAGFSAQALKTRILDTDCQLVITANESTRGNKVIPLKVNVDEALKGCPKVRTVIVVQNTETLVPWNHDRDFWYHNKIVQEKPVCEPVIMDAQDPLFILYTSGSTGKPKGIVHGTGGYFVYAAASFKYVFDYHANEIYWCTADVGWITGHTYGVYGPLANGATTLFFEGVPNYPTPARYWEMIDRHKVNIFYTAPTALRALRREGNQWVKKTKRTSLRILGTVGEPITPEAWNWYCHVVGNDRCPVVDTWWQTETGGIMITPFPGATPLAPGSSAFPFFGVAPVILDDEGNAVPDGTLGKLVITQPWPAMMQTLYKDQDRFVSTYFSEFPGKYLTGDLAYRDSDGYFWIAGRSDDVIKVSGHRIGSEEIESVLITHAGVAESAVVPIPDEIKGFSIYAYVTLRIGVKPSDNLKNELIKLVRTGIGPIATIESIQWTEALPKTRSGKIMRRILKKIANNEFEDLGDLTTLADPTVVEDLIKYRRQMTDKKK